MAKERNVRTVLVIGDNPDELMKKYDSNLKVEPYIKYRYLDADKMKKTALKSLQNLLDNADKIPLNDFHKEYLKEQVKNIQGMSSFEYYQNLTAGLYYDEDGNAMTDENPEGKYVGYNLGGNFSYPFTCNDLSEKYQAHANEIMWDIVHMRKEAVNYFDLVWEIKKNGKKPEGEYEEKIAKDWSERDNYLANFKTKDALISHNCSYWTYAVLDKNGWVSLDDGGSEEEWITNYMDRFIRPLNDELLTIFEFS